MNKIIRVNKKVIDFLMEIRKKDTSFYYLPRKINNKNRLEDGFWFIGNDDYLQLTFWNGTDWKERIHNIGFTISKDGYTTIDLSAQDSPEKAEFLLKIADRLKGFKRIGQKNRWHKSYEGKEYLENLSDFIFKIKPIIDQLIIQEKPEGISPLNKNAEKYIHIVETARLEQINLGDSNKVSRLVWNTNNWKSPSGMAGAPGSDFKAIHKYGHEEWLFDKSKIIDGFMYGFLQPLSMISNDHVGKEYNISLFTQDKSDTKYYVGSIENAYCLSKDESSEIYRQFKHNGWIDDMIDDLKLVDADWKKFKDQMPSDFVNIKFSPESISYTGELIEIAEDDLNITVSRYKLLPKVAEIKLSDTPDEEEQGNLKSTKKRKRIVHMETEIDPYHDKMQNEIFKILNKDDSYISGKVFIERDRVDLKAQTKTGQWHFFEIKTDSPRISIRKALGQIMEYAFYPNEERAQKLIVISDMQPTADDINYLNRIRIKHDIPVYYRWYSFRDNVLSEDL